MICSIQNHEKSCDKFFVNPIVFLFFGPSRPSRPPRPWQGKPANAFRAIFLCDARRFGIARLAFLQDSAASGHWAMVWMLGGFYSTVYVYIYLYLYIYIVLSCVRLFFRLGQSFCGATTGQSWSKPSPACTWPLG